MSAAFQSGAFQSGAFQTQIGISQFQYAVVIARSQTGLQGARSAFLEFSACFVTATYYDSNGNPFTPNAVSYGVWDATSRYNIVPWTALTPGDSNQVTVTSKQNTMISLSRHHEAHEVIFMITDGYGDVNYARCFYDLIRVPFPFPAIGGAFQSSAFQAGAFQE